MVFPNFLVIGAAKSGTTSLYSYLNQHPQIYMSPVKEPRFFALEGKEINYQGPAKVINRKTINSIEEYENLFDNVQDETAIGEASTLYLYHPQAAAKIKQYIPQAKLIAILRNPVERAFSSYQHLVRDGYETLSFEEALNAEKKRIADDYPPLWHYQQRGFYYQQLAQYFTTFPVEQIKVYLYEDLINNSNSMLEDIFNFLEVTPNFHPNTTQKMNASGTPKNRVLHKIITKIITQDNFAKSAVKSLLPKELRQNLYKKVKKSNLKQNNTIPNYLAQQLQESYRQDILQLQELLKRDLSTWLD